MPSFCTDNTVAGATALRLPFHFLSHVAVHWQFAPSERSCSSPASAASHKLTRWSLSGRWHRAVFTVGDSQKCGGTWRRCIIASCCSVISPRSGGEQVNKSLTSNESLLGYTNVKRVFTTASWGSDTGVVPSRLTGMKKKNPGEDWLSSLSAVDISSRVYLGRRTLGGGCCCCSPRLSFGPHLHRAHQPILFELFRTRVKPALDVLADFLSWMIKYSLCFFFASSSATQREKMSLGWRCCAEPHRPDSLNFQVTSRPRQKASPPPPLFHLPPSPSIVALFFSSSSAF